MVTKFYRQYPEDLLESDEVFDHQSAMTGEALNSKAEIAAELAYRDLVIKGLRAQLNDYGWHKSVCNYHVGCDCNCGFEQVAS